MRDLRVGAAQFEHRDGDPEYNLERIRELTRRAVERGAEIVSFHEGCLHGYSWVQSLSRAELTKVAEPVPDGPSVRRLARIARETGVYVMAGLFERDDAGRLYNSYVTVGPEGFITRFHKLHPFVNPHLEPGAG
ncbi:MAG: nitrilase, partial [Planctomycetota bacterium]